MLRIGTQLLQHSKEVFIQVWHDITYAIVGYEYDDKLTNWTDFYSIHVFLL